MNAALQEYLNTGHISRRDGTRAKIDVEVQPPTGKMLRDLIQKYQCKHTLEVGLGYGISALWIMGGTEGIPGTHHIAMDPLQGSYFNHAGLTTLREAGYGDRVTFHEEKSYLVLPALVEQKQKIDFAFIDGWHTFDYAFVDFFFVDKLLPIGGIVAFDDATWSQVRRVLRFAILNLGYEVIATADSNFSPHPLKKGIGKIFGHPQLRKFGEKIFRHDLMISDTALGIAAGAVALRKTKNDTRGGNDYIPF
ncbi:MAG: class I SAM-dependent methyltransferase [Chthoniobacterales bacterium]